MGTGTEPSGQHEGRAGGRTVSAARRWVVAAACAAVASGSSATPAFAAGWAAPLPIPVPTGIQGVSCASPSFCAAVDTSGYVVTFDGLKWSAPTRVDNPYDHFDAISCPSSSFCGAVDGDGNAATFNGHSWSGLTSLDRGVPLFAVSCPSASFCMAVDPNGNYSIYSGGSWSPMTSYGSVLGGPVSCSSASFCVAGGASQGNTDVFTYNGGDWSAQVGPSLVGVSCASVSFCGGFDNNGDAFTYNGAGWGAPQGLANADYPVVSISCPVTGFCVSVDGAHAFTYSGGSWSAPASLPARGNWHSVSCGSPSFCVAAASNGNAVSMLGGPPPPPGVRITSARVNQHRRSVKFRFKSTGKATGFECALVRLRGSLTRPPAFKTCKSPKTYTHLTPFGEYGFEVSALSPEGPGQVAARQVNIL